jgi:hypothetical protein
LQDKQSAAPVKSAPLSFGISLGKPEAADCISSSPEAIEDLFSPPSGRDKITSLLIHFLILLILSKIIFSYDSFSKVSHLSAPAGPAVNQSRILKGR